MCHFFVNYLLCKFCGCVQRSGDTCNSFLYAVLLKISKCFILFLALIHSWFCQDSGYNIEDLALLYLTRYFVQSISSRIDGYKSWEKSLKLMGPEKKVAIFIESKSIKIIRRIFVDHMEHVFVMELRLITKHEACLSLGRKRS